MDFGQRMPFGWVRVHAPYPALSQKGEGFARRAQLSTREEMGKMKLRFPSPRTMLASLPLRAHACGGSSAARSCPRVITMASWLGCLACAGIVGVSPQLCPPPPDNALRPLPAA
jgi:hypothetical protein